MTDTPEAEIAAFAKARERFLSEAFPKVYKRMQKEGTLAAHLRDTGEEAQMLFEQVEGDLRSQALKSKGSFEEVAKALQQAPIVASEIVMADVILAFPDRP